MSARYCFSLGNSISNPGKETQVCLSKCQIIKPLVMEDTGEEWKMRSRWGLEGMRRLLAGISTDV